MGTEFVTSTHEKHQKISKRQQQRKYENRTGLFPCLCEDATTNTSDLWHRFVWALNSMSIVVKASGHQIKLNSKQHLTLNNPSSVLKNYNRDHLWTTKDAFLCETFVKPLLCSIQLCTYKHWRWNLTFIKLLRSQMKVSSLYVIFEAYIMFQCKYPFNGMLKAYNKIKYCSMVW